MFSLPDTWSWRAWLCPRSWPIRRSRQVCSATLGRENCRSCPFRRSSSQPPWPKGVRGTTCEQSKTGDVSAHIHMEKHTRQSASRILRDSSVRQSRWPSQCRLLHPAPSQATAKAPHYLPPIGAWPYIIERAPSPILRDATSSLANNCCELSPSGIRWN